MLDGNHHTWDSGSVTFSNDFMWWLFVYSVYCISKMFFENKKKITSFAFEFWESEHQCGDFYKLKIGYTDGKSEFHTHG